MIACHLPKVDVRLMKAPSGGNLRAGAQTPLMKAAAGGHVEVVKKLLKAGAEATLVAGDY